MPEFTRDPPPGQDAPVSWHGVMTGHPGRAHAGGVPDPDDRPSLPCGRLYVISIRGRVGSSLLTAFGPMEVSTVPGRTVLRGSLEDQAALYGVLARIQSLGLELEEVRCLPDPPLPDAP
jgi:hypothetical protein